MIYRRLQPEDKVQVLSLLERSLEVWRTTDAAAYWEWKFERNPHGAARVWVAVEDGRLAGCYVWNPVRILDGDGARLGAQSVDAAVASDFRRRGIFTGLVETAMNDEGSRDLAAVYAFPVEAALRGQVMFGFEPRWTVTAVHRPLLGLRRDRTSGAFTAEAVTSFDSRFDALGTASDGARFRVARDAAYLQWRYLDHPANWYEAVACTSGGELLGYYVVSIGGGRVRRGTILDLEVAPEADGAAAFLVRHALRRLAGLGAKVAVSWLRPGGPERDALAAAGFSPRYQALKRRLGGSAYRPQFIVYENASTGTGGHAWSLVPGDHDST